MISRQGFVVATTLYALLALAAGATRATDAAAAAAGCHNITGTCLPHGFVCATGEAVPHDRRCDGVEDCADGTDEFMCHVEDGHVPLHERPHHARMHALNYAPEGKISSIPSCVECNCEVNAISIGPNNPWTSYAKVAPMDVALMAKTGPGTHLGEPCHVGCTWIIKLAFFKKNKVCRGNLCCIRQRKCETCFPLPPCTTATTANRCYP